MVQLDEQTSAWLLQHFLASDNAPLPWGGHHKRLAPWVFAEMPEEQICSILRAVWMDLPGSGGYVPGTAAADVLPRIHGYDPRIVYETQALILQSVLTGLFLVTLRVESFTTRGISQNDVSFWQTTHDTIHLFVEISNQ